MATTATTKNRPKKPYPGFPLFPHARGYWAKKIRGKTYYFGPWDAPDAALQQYLHDRDALHAGRKPPVEASDQVSLRHLCNVFLTAKKQLVESDELSGQHFRDLHRSCQRVIEELGKDRPIDDIGVEEFSSLRSKLASRWAPTTLGPELARIRSIFNYGYKSGVLDREVRAVHALAAPTRKVLRAHRSESAKKFFTAKEIHSLIAATDCPQFEAFIHLAINCGFGNRDCATIPRAAFDLRTGWVSFPRTKTGIDRRFPLWPETVSAVRRALKKTRKIEAESRELQARAFLTPKGRSWGEDKASSAISNKFSKVAKAADCYRKGVGFYALRHTFSTVGGECGDDVAVRFLMGHADDSIDAAYREHISDNRLKRVTGDVRQWLFGDT